MTYFKMNHGMLYIKFSVEIRGFPTYLNKVIDEAGQLVYGCNQIGQAMH